MATQQEITSLYQQLFGRNPDPAGLQYWMNSGFSGEDLKQALINGATNSAAGNDLDYWRNANLFNPPATSSTQTTAQPTTPSTTAPSYSSSLGQYAGSTDPYVQAAQATAQANLLGAQQATAANRVNQITPYGSLSYQQTGTDRQGNPVWSATQSLAPELQGAFGNIAGQVTQGTAQGFNPTLPSVGINPGETYEAAILRRLQPQQERQSKALETQLANQGVMPGSQAYETAKTQLAQQQNDQLTSAVVGGFQTGLAANQNAFNQGLTSYQLPLATLNQFKAATTPSYVNPSQQATVAGPDYLGAYTANQNYNLGLQNAQAASNAGLTSGLFGLGSAAILNPSAVGQIGRTVSGWFS